MTPSEIARRSLHRRITANPPAWWRFAPRHRYGVRYRDRGPETGHPRPHQGTLHTMCAQTEPTAVPFHSPAQF
jgi:hypothetical protein